VAVGSKGPFLDYKVKGLMSGSSGSLGFGSIQSSQLDYSGLPTATANYRLNK
jgi:hypothetical protein